MDDQNEKISEKEDNTKPQKSKTSLLKVLFVIGFVFLVVCFLVPNFIPMSWHFTKQMWCGANISGLGKAISLYASENDDKYPTAEKWCDLLIEHADVAPLQFVCRGSDAVIGESSYAFNKYLIGKKITEVPGDVVLLFETNFGKTPVGRDETISDRDYQKALGISDPDKKVYKLRWNQVGGSEILTTENHQGKGCNVLFNDTHVEFVNPEGLKDLKWKPEETKNE